MKNHAVVERGAGLCAGGEVFEVLDGNRCVVAEQVDLDCAVVGVDCSY